MSIRFCSILVILTVALADLSAGAGAQDPLGPKLSWKVIADLGEFELLQDAKRIVFLGDSITASGLYVAYFDAWLRLQNLPQKPVVINCGLPSETISGLSEEGHAGGKFPRPDLFERLDRVLKLTKPDLVIACYGMNCGIYQPLEEARFARYREGIERLKRDVEAVRAPLVLLGPPCYDDRRKPLGFSYDDVLGEYSRWLRSQESKLGRKEGWLYVGIRTWMNENLKTQRRQDPDFTFQPDGVHPNEEGHWEIARPVVRYFGEFGVHPWTSWREIMVDYPAADDDAKSATLVDLCRKRTSVLRDAYVATAGHKRPGVAQGLPLEEAEKKYQEYSAEIDKLLGAPPAKP
jgi:lysophospholipase L1-like esterase